MSSFQDQMEEMCGLNPKLFHQAGMHISSNRIFWQIFPTEGEALSEAQGTCRLHWMKGSPKVHVSMHDSTENN